MENNNILQYESKIWATADLLRGCGIKESEWPSFMMPFFALVMIESRLLRMLDDIKTEIGEQAFADIEPSDLQDIIKDKGQGYNIYIFEKNKTLKDLCANDKAFNADLDAYLHGYDGETKDLLGVDASEGEKFLDIKGVITKLNAKKVLFNYVKEWSGIDLKPFNNSDITTLEEHIKRKWADISAETAGEQYTPDDVIALIAEIIASKIQESDTLLKIYDCTCGGGNMLFGVEDRINDKFKRFTQTYGQDWNDALYALAKIESRFRAGSKIEHGNTLVEDKFYDDYFDVVVANPPYGVSWKGYQKDIEHDKTGRFHYLPSISDGQLLFMQHLIAKLKSDGMGVVVHNGSTLFSGDAGSAESNIRKWMLDSDIVEAIIQLPTDEFFNTGIYTYLWVLNKNKQQAAKNKIMLINASEKYKPLKKSKGSKRKEVDEINRLDIIETLKHFQNNDYAKVFDKESFYFNKQAILLTNIDEDGKFLTKIIKIENKFDLIVNNEKLIINDGKQIAINYNYLIHHHELLIVNDEFLIEEGFITLEPTQKNVELLKQVLSSLDYKEHQLQIHTQGKIYLFDHAKESLAQASMNNHELIIYNYLGCGKIIIKTAYKKATNKTTERIEISIELTPDTQKDYEIIPFHKDNAINQQTITDFMAKYITKPFQYLDNTIGVEINFNKVFYKPETLRPVTDILNDIKSLDEQLHTLETELSL